MENLFNVNQAAFILRVHPLTIRRYIREGKLNAVRVGGNIRIKESQLQEFNKDISPSSFRRHRTKQQVAVTKVFSIDDPLFRLQGRGASLHLSTEG